MTTIYKFIYFLFIPYTLIGQITIESKKIILPEGVKVINCIDADQEKIIWVGTKYYLGKIENDNIIKVDTIAVNKLNIDFNNNKWIGQYKGVRFMDKFDSIHNFHKTLPSKIDKSLNNEFITSICSYEHTVYFGTSKGIMFSYDKENTKWKKIKTPTEGNIQSICVTEEDIFIATSNGLFNYRKLLSNWHQLNEVKSAYKVIAKKKIPTEEQEYWAIGTNSKNRTTLFKIINNKTNKYYFNKDDLISSISKDSLQFNSFGFRDFDISPNDNIWIATDGGLFLYESHENKWNYFDQSEKGVQKLKLIRHILIPKNSNNTIWIGMIGEHKGLYKLKIKDFSEECGLYYRNDNVLIFEENDSLFVKEYQKQAHKYLDKIGEYLQKNPDNIINIKSFTEVNHLKKARFNYVKNYLNSNHYIEDKRILFEESTSKKESDTNKSNYNRRILIEFDCD